MSSVNELLAFWETYDYNQRDKVHPMDSELSAAERICISSYEQYCQSPFYFQERGELHTGLIPIPFLGNVREAKIYFLLLNPGLSAQDYFDEERSEYKERMINTLQQRDFDEYPFYALNPKFGWTDGGRWWHRKFRPLTEILVERRQISYLEATRLLSTEICAFELFPYHSRSFSLSAKTLRKCKSVELIVKAAQELWRDKSRFFLVMRGASTWGIRDSENAKVISGQEARAAHITNEYVERMLQYID